MVDWCSVSGEGKQRLVGYGWAWTARASLTQRPVKWMTQGVVTVKSVTSQRSKSVQGSSLCPQISPRRIGSLC